MINNLLTGLLLLFFLIAILYKAKKNEDKNYFMGIECTKFLKGVMCIIVVLVHIPTTYSNTVQDAIGSFGYICVTSFFMFSAYGLMYSVKNKKDYINNFIRKRLLVLLIPYFITNIISLVLIREPENILDTFLYILGIKTVSFVTVLILFYILFYIVQLTIKNEKIKTIMLILFPILYSIFNYIVGIDRWYIEELGFSYGIILFDKFKWIRENLNRKKIIKFIIFSISSLMLGIVYIKIKNIAILGDYILKVILGISLILWIFEITNMIKLKNKIMLYLGDISYEIYLLHGIVIVMLERMPIASSWIYIYAVIIITIVLASVLKRLDKVIIEKIKR